MKKSYLILSLLACLVIPAIPYLNSLNTPFVYDDYKNIVDNPGIKQAKKEKMSYVSQKVILPQNYASRPLTYLTFKWNYSLGKLNPFGYHLFNLLLHCLSTLFIFLLSRRIFLFLASAPSMKDPPQKGKKLKNPSYQTPSLLFPLGAALLFGVHPVNTEVVTYVTHRSDCLATLFYLSSLFLFIQSIDKKKIFYILSLLCFVLSLYSKQIAVTLPAALLLFDYIFISHQKSGEVWKRKKIHIPYWGVLAAYLIYYNISFGKVGDLGDLTLERWSSLSYLLTQAGVLLKYLIILISLTGQCFDHYIPPPLALTDLTIWIPLVLVLALGAGVFYAIKIFPKVSKLILFSAGWVILTLLPTSSILPINDAMAERRLYLPGLGLFLGLASIYMIIFKVKVQDSLASSRMKILFVFLTVHILVLSLVTWKRNKIYQNPLHLWEEVLALYPNSPRGLATLGEEYFRQAQFDQAIQLFKKALGSSTQKPHINGNIASAYHRKGDLSRAIEYYQISLAEDPNQSVMHSNLAEAFYKQGLHDKAQIHYETSLKINPWDSGAHNNFGKFYFNKGLYQKALSHFKKSLESNPENYTAIVNSGVTLNRLDHYQEAILYYRQALKIKPNDPMVLNSIGTAHYMKGEKKQAAQFWEKSCLFGNEEGCANQKKFRVTE